MGVQDSSQLTFAEMKQNVFFTEKRLALLLESQFYPEMSQWVKEKLFVRKECKNECAAWVERLENCIEGKMRGLWHPMRIVQAFNVEVNLQSLVGSEWYEKPRPAATQEAAKLIERIRELGLLVPGNERHAPSAKNVANLIERFESIDWSVQDMARFSEALRAKEKLLLEVSELTKTLQEVGWGCSIHETKKEELRRLARQAECRGEVDMFSQYAHEEVEVSEALMQLLLFKLQTTESSQAENTLKRRNNVSQWKLAAAQLETLKEHKHERQAECLRDKERVKRGLAYEATKDEEAREDFNKRKKLFADRLAYLNRTQDELACVLQELCEKFKDVEEKLADLTWQREEAIQARVDMIETEQQRVADYEEFVQFAKKHTSYVDETQRMAEESAELINCLQKFLMNEQEYDEHDFHETTKLLHDTKVQTLRQLNVCYIDYCTRVTRIARQLDAQIREVDAEGRRHQMMAECFKETLNPEAKRHVMQAKEVLCKREQLLSTRNTLLSKIDFIRTNYLSKVKEELPAHEVVEVGAELEEELLNRRDDLLTMRESVAYSQEHSILDEKEAILAMSDRVREEQESGANRLVKKLRGRTADAAAAADAATPAAPTPDADESHTDESHTHTALDEQPPPPPPEAAEPEAASASAATATGGRRREHRSVAAVQSSRKPPRADTEALAAADPAVSASSAAVPSGDVGDASTMLPSPGWEGGVVDELSVTKVPQTIRSLEQKHGQGMFPSLT